MTNLPNNNMNLYKKSVDNEKLKKKLKSDLLDLLYFEYNKYKKKRMQNNRKK